MSNRPACNKRYHEKYRERNKARMVAYRLRKKLEAARS